MAKAKVVKAKAKPTPPKLKRLVKGHWSGYTDRSADQVRWREIANTIERCCSTSIVTTIQLLWEGLDNVVNIAGMTN